MQDYFDAKAKLFAWPSLRHAVINIDDDYGRQLVDRLPASLQLISTSSSGRKAGLNAEAIRLGLDGMHFSMAFAGEQVAVASPLLGRFNVDNLLAVAGVLHALGDTPSEIARTLSRLLPIHGRMNRLGGDTDASGQRRPLVVIDYAHTPDALEQALASLRDHVQGRLVCVFGCGGDRDAGKRPQMAEIAERLADVVIVTDDNPRTEDGDRIVADILAGFARPDAATVQRDRGLAIAHAIALAGADDIVLVAGKGHEPYQDIQGVKHPFDDTAVARKALEERA
jgi:UDP-N-acetylmuramoyl-L-alanyl-D-glutamate--2,6-diaminopimelate ligase